MEDNISLDEMIENGLPKIAIDILEEDGHLASRKHVKEKDDPVNHPSHYTFGGIECIDAIRASMSVDEFKGYLKGCCMKYLWRYRNKGNAEQDLAKCRFYLDKLMEVIDE